jgi:rRNA maturation protein Nop10
VSGDIESPDSFIYDVKDASTCPHCGSEMRYVAVIADPTTTKDIYKCEACRRYFSEVGE